MLRKLSVGLACLAVLATGAACTATPSGGGSGPLPVSYNILAAAPYVLQPTKPPAGSNNNSCKPTAAHPYPVVLVNGTIATMGENWPVLSPLLKNNGYCVFAFNYGGTWLSSLLLGNIQGLDSAAGSANELKSYVNFVLGQTGATKVDLVGHSQGGMLPNYYVKFLGGAPKVHSIIGLAPDNHGTTLSGLVTLGNKFSQFFPPLMPFINIMLGLAAPSFVDQQIGSPFIQQLNSLPDTVPGINYTVIATKYDEVVTRTRRRSSTARTSRTSRCRTSATWTTPSTSRSRSTTLRSARSSTPSTRRTRSPRCAARSTPRSAADTEQRVTLAIVWTQAPYFGARVQDRHTNDTTIAHGVALHLGRPHCVGGPTVPRRPIAPTRNVRPGCGSCRRPSRRS